MKDWHKNLTGSDQGSVLNVYTLVQLSQRLEVRGDHYAVDIVYVR